MATFNLLLSNVLYTKILHQSIDGEFPFSPLSTFDRSILLPENSMRSSLLRSSQFPMTPYHQQLHPWCIVCFMPNAQTLVVARLRRRNDAEAHLRILRQMTPDRSYEIVFDAPQGQQQ